MATPEFALPRLTDANGSPGVGSNMRAISARRHIH